MTTFTSEDRKAAEEIFNEDKLLGELKDCAQFFEDRLYKQAATLITKLRAENEQLKINLGSVAPLAKGHSYACLYQHFLSYSGHQHTEELCKAYFDGANAPQAAFEAELNARKSAEYSCSPCAVCDRGDL